jgi:hypothetical protein
MKQFDWFNVGLTALSVVLALALIVGIALVCHTGDDCEKRGGVFFYAHGSQICLRKDAVLP